MQSGRSTLVVLCLAFAALSTLLDESMLSLYVLFVLASIVTVGLSLLMGHAGQVSLGQGAFYACGAYTAGACATHGWPGVLALAAAPLTAGALAAAVGVPLFVLRGHHLAFATLALHLIFLSVIGEVAFVGGDVGLQGIPPLRLGPFEPSSVRGYAYLSSAVLLVVVALAQNILASRHGRALRALSTSESAAASSGIRVGRYKLAVFALSAAFAGLGGGIYAFFMGYLAPGSFPVVMSIEYVVMASVGGLGTISGAVLGTAIVMILVHVLSRIGTMSGMPSTAPAVFSYAVYASLLIAVVLYVPHGIAPLLTERAARLLARARRALTRKSG